MSALTQPRDDLLDVHSVSTHAHAYLQEAFFPETVTPDLRLPNAVYDPKFHYQPEKCVDTEECMLLSSLPRMFHGNAEIQPELPAQYWEVTLVDGPSLGQSRAEIKVQLEIGYSIEPWRRKSTILYCGNGDVNLCGHAESACFSAMPFGFGDVVGCGYIHPTTYIFTKNGELVASVRGEDSGQNLLPIAKVNLLLRDEGDEERMIILHTNFGHTGFRFNMVAHLGHQIPWRRLAATLPPEILEHILEHTLQIVDKGLPSAEELRNLQRLSQVSQRWRILCIRPRYTVLEISSIFDLNYASSIQPWFHYRRLKIQEQRTMPWIHRLLATPILHQLYLPPQGSLEGLDVDFHKRVVPRVYLTIPAVLRNTFVRLQVLELSHCLFSSWLSFAKFVFAFPALSELMLGPAFSCRIDGSVPTFPRWLRFTQRLLHVTSSDGKVLDHLLWLFISGQQRNIAKGTQRQAAMPERDLTLSQRDASTMFSVLKIASEICSRAYSIHYNARSDTDCTLSYLNSETMCFSFSFRKQDRLYIPVLIELSCPKYTGGAHFMEINSLLDQLSNSADCRCRFDVTPEMGCQKAEGNRQVAIAHQQNILAVMHQRHSTGLINFVYDGEEMTNSGPGPVEFMSIPSPSFGLLIEDHVLWAGGLTTITWDVDCVALNTSVIPWIKLFEADSAPEYGKYIADLAQVVDARVGKADLSIPASIESGLYFLAVGCYTYRTELFVVISESVRIASMENQRI